MNKKLMSIILAAGMAVGMMAGCGDFSDQPETSEGGTTADGKTEVIFYHWTPIPEMELMEKTFNETHDDIHLTYKPIPDSPDAMIKMNTMLMANEPMDVTSQWSTDHLQLRVENNLLEGLDQYFEKNGLDYEEVFGSAASEITTVNGDHYSMPYANKLFAVMYNKSIFDEAGVAYPEEGWTWDEFDEIAKKVSSGEGVNRVYGTCFLPKEAWYYRASLKLGLNAMYKEDGSASNFDDPAFLESLQWLYDLQEAGAQKPFNEFAEASLDAQANRIALFYKGGYAMDIVATYPVSNWGSLSDNAHDFEVGIVTMPVEKKGDPLQTMYEFSDLSMVASSKNKDAAFEFMKWYCIERPDVCVAEKYMQPTASYFPSEEIEQICIDKIYSCEGVNTDEMLHAFTSPESEIARIPGFKFTTIATAQSEIVGEMDKQIEQVFFNEKTPEEAIKDLKANADELIAKAK